MQYNCLRNRPAKPSTRTSLAVILKSYQMPGSCQQKTANKHQSVSIPTMSLQGMRDFIIAFAPMYRVLRKSPYIARRGGDVIRAAEAYLKCYGITEENDFSQEKAEIACDDLRRTGVIVLLKTVQLK